MVWVPYATILIPQKRCIENLQNGESAQLPPPLIRVPHECDNFGPSEESAQKSCNKRPILLVLSRATSDTTDPSARWLRRFWSLRRICTEKLQNGQTVKSQQSLFFVLSRNTPSRWYSWSTIPCMETHLLHYSKLPIRAMVQVLWLRCKTKTNDLCTACYDLSPQKVDKNCKTRIAKLTVTYHIICMETQIFPYSKLPIQALARKFWTASRLPQIQSRIRLVTVPTITTHSALR